MLSFWGAPLPPYIKEQGGGSRPRGEARHRAGRPPPLLLYIQGQGAPLDTQVDQLISPSRVRCPPPPYSTSFISSWSLGEALRRRTSSSSPCRRADETLPQHSAGPEFEGRHRAERVLNSEVPCVRYLIGRIMKTYDYINRVVLTLPLSVYEGTWTTLSPLVAMHHHDLACA